MRSLYLIHLTSLGYRCLTCKIGLVESLGLPIEPVSHLVWHRGDDFFFSYKKIPDLNCAVQIAGVGVLFLNFEMWHSA